jgi:uncharacterized RDD family membrane protein YckC
LPDNGGVTPDPSHTQPPQSAAPDERRPCGLARRLAIMLYDAFAVLAVLLLATALAMAAGFRDVTAGRDPLFTAWLVLAWFGYLAGCWRSGGMTVGMRAWRVVIEADDGGRPGWGACLLRFAVSLLSAAAAGLGFAWALFRRDRRTWHDLASRTRLWRAPR